MCELKSNAERMNLVFARAKKDKNIAGRQKAEFLQSGNRPAFRSFAVLHRIISDIVQSAAVAGYCGAILLIDGMGGYVLTAVVTFIIATVITVICIKIKNRRDRK